jgi:hypothetical protein
LWWSQNFYHRYQDFHGKKVMLGHPSARVYIPHQLKHPDLKLANHVNLENFQEVKASAIGRISPVFAKAR